MTTTKTTSQTMRLSDLPPVSRSPWLELLRAEAESADDSFSHDLAAHWRVYASAIKITEEGIVHTLDGRAWFMDDDTPYEKVD